MSYINEALRKAQAEKDHCYGKLDYAVAAVSEKRRREWPKRVAVGAVILAIAAAAGFFSVKFFATPGSIVQKFPESLAKRGTVFADSTAKREALKTAKPAATPVAKEGALQKGAAEPSSADSGKSPDAKKTAELKRRHAEAALAQRSGNLSKAKVIYGEILTLDADNVEALNNLGVVYLAEKQGDRALALFRRAVLLKRDYADPYYNMACLYAQKNDIEQSLWYLKMAISIDKEVANWVKKDSDMKKVIASPKFKEIDGGANN